MTFKDLGFGSFGRFRSRLSLGLLTLAAITMAPGVAGIQETFALPNGPPAGSSLPNQQADQTPPYAAPPIPLTAKQKQELLKSQFDKMKQEAKTLVQLAQSLQTEVDKSNENVLSLQIVDKAEKVEKLARKIKGEARGY